MYVRAEGKGYNAETLSEGCVHAFNVQATEPSGYTRHGSTWKNFLCLSNEVLLVSGRFTDPFLLLLYRTTPPRRFLRHLGQHLRDIEILANLVESSLWSQSQTIFQAFLQLSSAPFRQAGVIARKFTGNCCSWNEGWLPLVEDLSPTLRISSEPFGSHRMTRFMTKIPHYYWDTILRVICRWVLSVAIKVLTVRRATGTHPTFN